MPITAGRYRFDGTYASTEQIENRSGVYIVLDYINNEYRLLDVGESSNVRTRLETHDRREQWRRNSRGTICFAVYYTPNLQQPGRIEIEQEIRQQYNPPCGEH